MDRPGTQYPIKGDLLSSPAENLPAANYRLFFGREPADSGPVHLTNYEALILKLERTFEANSNQAVQLQAEIRSLQKRIKKARKALKRV